MGKVIRNTVFTVIVLVLTAVGLHWNRQISAQTNPVQISQTVLSAATTDATQAFPLSVSFDKAYLKLGQYQTLQIVTSPQAQLKIATIYPNGRTDNDQTLTAVADETGRYTLRFKIDDFAELGVFETRVIAQLGQQQSTGVGRFALQSLSDTTKSGASNYLYPLLP